MGYLASVLLQNQPRVRKEKERVEEAQRDAELPAGIDESLLKRVERLRKKQEAEEAGE